MNKRYIVEHGLPKTVSGCETVQDLTRYLETDPHPKYRLVNCQRISGTYQLVYQLVWELI
jgi:hypothetical protein